MTAFDPITIGNREAAEIEALMRALRNLRHWSATAAARRSHRDDRGRRLHVAAARLRDVAWAESLRAAYALFEIDAIHEAWLTSDGAPAIRPDAGTAGQALAAILSDISCAEASARRHDRAAADRDFHAGAAQCADERAEAGRNAARAMIERAFPGVRWAMIAEAAL